MKANNIFTGVIAVLALIALVYSVPGLIPEKFSVFGGSVNDLGDFKASIHDGDVRINVMHDFKFTKDANGIGTFVIHVKYPAGTWVDIDTTSIDAGAKYAKAGHYFSEYSIYGLPKPIDIVLLDNPGTNYKVPVGRYVGYAAFTSDNGNSFPPLSSGVMISDVYEFQFDVVPDTQRLCVELDTKCIVNTKYLCENGAWELEQTCAYKCEISGGEAKCITKPITCGDGSCKAPEDKYNCPIDCTSTLECTAGAVRCEDDRYMSACVHIASTGLYSWSRVDDCAPQKCVVDIAGTPYCKEAKICNDADLKCNSDKNQILTCKNNAWSTFEDCGTGKCTDPLLSVPKCVAPDNNGEGCLIDDQCNDDNFVTKDKCVGAVQILNLKGTCSHQIDPILIVGGVVALIMLVLGGIYMYS
jgi:hypothetical protein